MTRPLTPAARGYLELIQAGEHPSLTYGPFCQLRDAGYITGTQDDWWVV